VCGCVYVWFCDVLLCYSVGFLMCMGGCCNVWMFGFCNLWVCVCVGFVMCGCVYVWVL